MYVFSLKRTELIAKEGSHMHSICDKFTSIHSGYRPTIWCFPSTLNTIVFAKFQGCIKQNYHREILTTQDGGIFYFFQYSNFLFMLFLAKLIIY